MKTTLTIDWSRTCRRCYRSGTCTNGYCPPCNVERVRVGRDQTPVECVGCLDTIYLHKAHHAEHGWLCHACWQEETKSDSFWKQGKTVTSDLEQLGQDLVRGSVEISRMQESQPTERTGRWDS